MSELIAMRQRIKAVTTIKKITHAMRLTAMSSHARLKNKRALLQEYNQALLNLVNNIAAKQSTLDHHILWPTNTANKTLIIIIGAQKGLCGNLNNNIITFAQESIKKIDASIIDCIAVGKKALDGFAKDNTCAIAHYTEFTMSKVPYITNAIVEHICNTHTPYDKALVYYNDPKNFFSQIPTAYHLIPVTLASEHITTMHEGYYWQQDRSFIFNTLARTLLSNTIHSILLQALIAEQAARFIAMDSSTRNASTILDTMRMNYNKLRQAKITRELTDLAASF